MQPQEVRTFSIVIGCVPVFVNLYFAMTNSSFGLELKVCCVVSHVSCPKAVPVARQSKKRSDFIRVHFEVVLQNPVLSKKYKRHKPTLLKADGRQYSPVAESHVISGTGH